MSIKDGSRLAEVVSGTTVPVSPSTTYPTGAMMASAEQAVQNVVDERGDSMVDVPSRTKPFSTAAFPVSKMEADRIMAEQRGRDALSKKKSDKS